jgi:replicative DNA helicase
MIENIVLSQLISNEEYIRRALPFIKGEYFFEPPQKFLFETIDTYIQKYNSIPTKEALNIEVENTSGISEGLFKNTVQLLESLEPQTSDINWLIDQTEKFCQDKALYNAIRESLKIIEKGESGNISKGNIPNLLQDALSVSFDPDVGHDYTEDADSRYEYYTRKESRLAFHLEILNIITNGGLLPKTLNMVMAGPGVGKTMFMTDCASSYLMDGKNVVYITLEISEEEIGKRIDANLLNTRLDDLESLTHDEFNKKIEKVRERTGKKLIIKEYPAGSANASHFRYFLNELRLKKNFVPDVVIIDYLNICSSARVKAGGSVNSYSLIKSVAEEIRGLASEFKIPIITATQVNRSGSSDSDFDMDSIADSFGIAYTVDLLIGLATNDELYAINQITAKQLKNRYRDMNKNKRFYIGVERDKMRLYDVDQSKVEDDDGPVFDKGQEGSRKKPATEVFSSFFSKNK